MGDPSRWLGVFVGVVALTLLATPVAVDLTRGIE